MDRLGALNHASGCAAACAGGGREEGGIDSGTDGGGGGHLALAVAKPHTSASALNLEQSNMLSRISGKWILLEKMAAP